MTSSERNRRLIDIITLLTVPGVGRGRYWKLLKQFGSVEKVLRAPVHQVEAISGLGRAVASAIAHEADRDAAAKVAAQIEEYGWTVLFAGADGYPPMLEEIPDKPPVLFARGELPSADDKMIAIVGTRHASDQGKMFTARLASDLVSAGVTVVSGMAEGIDTAAHAGALEAGGRTIAVWGTSLEITYPPSNKHLAERITERGTIFSEYFPGQGPDRSTFPDRNRIISGLSDGVVVVEAGKKSGALITAELALQQGRELFAVPGPPTADRSIGANSLLKKGARLVTSVEDIFEELPRLRGEVAARRFKAVPNVTDTEQQVIDHLADGPCQVDMLAQKLGLTVSEVLEYLLALELKGIVQELSGKRYVLCE
ncbi:DNA-protecting protein DprA [candidate division GN15 bacterium]|nr:DNA-protecting protein DprA [candidate division GN15 bacterium]